MCCKYQDILDARCLIARQMPSSLIKGFFISLDITFIETTIHSLQDKKPAENWLRKLSSSSSCMALVGVALQ